MEDFIESRNLDKDTAEMLRAYDKDGNGVFSKGDVVSIILDLRKERVNHDELATSNKVYKRLLWSAIVLCFLSLAGMFALSCGVAALTATTYVSSDGTLMVVGTDTVVAADYRAEVHSLPMIDNGFYCLTWDEVDLMHMQVLNGRNVVLHQINLNGSERISTISEGGVTIDGDKTCFATSTGETECASSSAECEGRAAGRTLSADERRRLGLPERRRLDHDEAASWARL
jgi:hypothetical protein